MYGKAPTSSCFLGAYNRRDGEAICLKLSRDNFFKVGVGSGDSDHFYRYRNRDRILTTTHSMVSINFQQSSVERAKVALALDNVNDTACYFFHPIICIQAAIGLLMELYISDTEHLEDQKVVCHADSKGMSISFERIQVSCNWPIYDVASQRDAHVLHPNEILTHYSTFLRHSTLVLPSCWTPLLFVTETAKPSPHPILLSATLSLSIEDSVPADLQIVEASSNVRFNRSLLTGESDMIPGYIDATSDNILETCNLANNTFNEM
ncbi:hypothetical protein BDY19DRAFT_910584 [Irpex rosettiformis]|uniref:Uncharacterized protein n=1 Tax=Irpex rosettiformis TaxID=378272 RepID=A0ACB8TN49_9APHY|nr:hypothetical protein BDY19DRAFT_910584 [Irpex rosettiformis]